MKIYVFQTVAHIFADLKLAGSVLKPLALQTEEEIFLRLGWLTVP